MLDIPSAELTTDPVSASDFISALPLRPRRLYTTTNIAMAATVMMPNQPAIPTAIVLMEDANLVT